MGRGGAGSVIYGVANMHQARCLAQLLHWHEQPHEAFHHRGGALRSGVVALGKNGTSLDDCQLITSLWVFDADNATCKERSQRVAISTLFKGQLCFQGFFRLVQLGPATGEYQEATFEKL